MMRAYRLWTLMMMLSLAISLCVACGDDDDDDDDTGNDDDIVNDDDTEPVDPPEGSSFAETLNADATFRVERLSAPVEVLTDEFGVPHIYGAAIHDMLYVQGYLHADNRIWLMDAFRHVAQGRLSEYLGALGVTFDVEFRATFMTADGRNVTDAVIDQLDEESVALLESYSAGVNAWLAEARAGEKELPPDYSTPLMGGITAEDIPDWGPRDTIGVARTLEWILTDGEAAGDLTRGEQWAKLPAGLFHDTVRFQPPTDAVILPGWYDQLDEIRGKRMGAWEAGSAALKAKLARFDWGALDPQGSIFNFMAYGGRGAIGSNNWVVRGEHTATGNPLVVNDPHLPFSTPPLFYHNHLSDALYGEGETVDAIGTSLLGFGGISLGHNGRVAWGATTVFWDVVDVYVETLNEAGDAVLLNGDWVPIERYEEQFQVGSGADATIETHTIEYVPHHGPILPESKTDDSALSVAWIGRMWDGDTEVRAIFEMMFAEDIDEWMEAIRNIKVLGQNWNAADVEGTQAYNPHGWIPIRKSVSGDCAPWRPMDGTGPCEWEGTIPTMQVPHVINAPGGYLATANNDIVGNLQDNDPTNDEQYLYAERVPGFRARRIMDALQEKVDAGGGMTAEEMRQLQADTYSLEAERLVPLVLAAAEAQSDEVAALGLEEAFGYLRDWGFATPTGSNPPHRIDGGPDAAEIDQSIAAMIYFAFIPRLEDNVFDDDTGEHGVWLDRRAKTRALFFLLEQPDEAQVGAGALFDDRGTPEVETFADIVIATMAETVEWLASDDAFGTDDMQQWRWGELHKIDIVDLFGLLAGVSFNSLGPFTQDGSRYTVDNADPRSDDPEDFTFDQGPVFRAVMEVNPDGVIARSSLPGGQSDDPGDPHFDDLLEPFLRNETFPYYYTVEDVLNHAEKYEVWGP